MPVQRTPVSLAAVDAIAVEMARRPTLSDLLARPLPDWLNDIDAFERFWTHVVGDIQTHCWVWTARSNRYGHAQVKLGGGNQGGHRLAYMWLVGPIPLFFVIDHLCRNRLCVNPSHLEAVTARENTRRGLSPQAANARKTHCPRGHPYDETNTIWLPNKAGRRCRACSSSYYMEHREQMHAQRNAAYRARAEALGKAVLPAPGKRTHCRNGHPYDAENTYVTSMGHRQCRTCNKRREDERSIRRRQQ